MLVKRLLFSKSILNLTNEPHQKGFFWAIILNLRLKKLGQSKNLEQERRGHFANRMINNLLLVLIEVKNPDSPREKPSL